jgi:ABC-type antimicrobial peptide transport system permease subunit
VIVREGAAIAGIGIAVGLLAASLVTRWIGGLLFGVTPLDLPTFTIVPALFAGVAIAASYLPARRAARVDPIVALRAE